MSSATTRTVFRVALILYAAWALFYIFRTSFDLDGDRVFLLWDDAMVSMRYARNLAIGNRLVWNAGESVEGFSNLGLTLVMAGIHRLPLDRTKTALVFQLLNLAALMWSIVLVRNIARRVFDSELAGLVAGLGVMACGPLAVLALQGTDVTAICLIILIATHRVVRATEHGEDWPSGIYTVLALGIVCRLDFFVVYLVFAAVSLAFTGGRASVPRALVLFAITVVAILGFQRFYYGDALPNTYYLKMAGQPIRLMIAEGLRQRVSFFGRSALALSITVAALATWQRTDRRLWLIAGIVSGLTLYDIRAGGDWIDNYTSRFFAPALPLLILACAGAMVHVFRRAIGGWSPRHAIVCLALGVIACAQFNTPEAFWEWVYPFRETMYWTNNVANTRLARYLGAHTDVETTVAVHWAGLPAYFLDRPMIDVLGKSDAYIAHTVVARFSPGHSKWDWPYIVDVRRPDIIVSSDYYRLLDTRADFRSLYVRVKARDVEFFMRQESLGKLHDPEARVSAPTSP